MKQIFLHWWPPLAFLVPIIAVQRMWFGGYDASGHAAGHLGGATAIFALAFVAAVLVWAAPAEIQRRAELWVLASAVVAASVIPTIGNLRVVDAIGKDEWSDDQASALGPARGGFTSGHELAERGMWMVVACAVLLAAWLWWSRAVGTKAGIAGIIVSIIFPPWIFPGAGLLVLAITLVVHRARRLRRAAPTARAVYELT